MNNDIKDLLLAKKEKINEWLDYLSSEDDDVIWIQKNRVFCTVLYNIIYKLQKVASDDFIKKQEELINNIHHYINNRDRLKVKEIVNKIKDLDNGKEISDDTDFNNYDQVINDIDNKLEQLKKEELEGKTPEEQEKINEQWNKEDKIFNDIASSIINDINKSKINYENKENLDDSIKISKHEYELLKKSYEDSYKMQRTDFALIINSGAVLPGSHSNYNNDRVKIEIYDINNHNIEIDGKKYIIKTQVLFNKIKSFIDNNIDLLIDWAKKETNYFLDNNAYDGGKSRNIKVKYGQLLINVNGQVSGKIGKNAEEFINEIKDLIISESILKDKDQVINNLVENDLIEKNNSYSDSDRIFNLIVNEIEKMDDGAYFNFMELVNHFIELANGTANSKDINLNKIYDDILKKLEESNINIKPVITNATSQSQEKLYIKVGKKEIPTEVSNLLKNFVSFDENGYAFANQELPSELKSDYNTFIKNYYANDNNKVVNNIVNKIREIPYNTETSVAQLINYKPEVAFVSPLTQGIIINAVEKKCNDYNIKLEFSSDSFGGLAYFEKFKKIN